MEDQRSPTGAQGLECPESLQARRGSWQSGRTHDRSPYTCSNWKKRTNTVAGTEEGSSTFLKTFNMLKTFNHVSLIPDRNTASQQVNDDESSPPPPWTYLDRVHLTKRHLSPPLSPLPDTQHKLPELTDCRAAYPTAHHRHRPSH